jgi:hypothetical protein
MKQWRIAVREAITKITGIMPEAIPDKRLFIAKAEIRETLLDCLWIINTHENEKIPTA